MFSQGGALDAARAVLGAAPTTAAVHALIALAEQLERIGDILEAEKGFVSSPALGDDENAEPFEQASVVHCRDCGDR